MVHDMLCMFYVKNDGIYYLYYMYNFSILINVDQTKKSLKRLQTSHNYCIKLKIKENKMIT